MPTHAKEIAYCTARIARSTALALASPDNCARASHIGFATAYRERLAALTLALDKSMSVDTVRNQPAVGQSRVPPS